MGGTGPDGLDCYTLAKEIYRRAGVQLPEYASFVNLAIRDTAISNGTAAYFERIESPEPFCLVTFKIRPPFITHIGVVLADGFHFIHIMKRRLCCIERIDAATWKNRIEGYYRYAG